VPDRGRQYEKIERNDGGSVRGSAVGRNGDGDGHARADMRSGQAEGGGCQGGTETTLLRGGDKEGCGGQPRLPTRRRAYIHEGIS
jgi:hypothetical protein